MRICSVEDCNSVHRALGYCDKHWGHHKKYGYAPYRTNKSPNEIIEDGDVSYIVLYKKHVPVAKAIIDTEDVAKVERLRWCYSCGYAKSGSDNIPLHEIIVGKRADHINRNPLDNRKTNLRVATHVENLRNSGLPRHNTSGYKGVCRIKGTDKWHAAISLENWPIHLGRYDTPEEAAYVYDQVAIQLGGEFAWTNFDY